MTGRITYKWKVSLNLGDQLLLLDLVECLRFLSARWGPIRCTSMNGRNIPFVLHLTSFAATTENIKERQITHSWLVPDDHMRSHAFKVLDYPSVIFGITSEILQCFSTKLSNRVAKVMSPQRVARILSYWICAHSPRQTPL